MEIRDTPRPKGRRVPEWEELTEEQQQLVNDLLYEYDDCIDFEFNTDQERKDLEALRDLGWVSLSYRVANGVRGKMQ